MNVDALLSKAVTSIGRKMAFVSRLDQAAKGTYGWRPVDYVTDMSKANLVSSQLPDGQHAPAIDIDIPCYLVDSSTPGHFHLYIEKAMSWKDYDKLLKVLVEVGIVEKEYYAACKDRNASFLRLPHVKKKPSSATVNL